MAQLLIHAGAIITDENKNNIIKQLIILDWFDILKLLIEKGVDINDPKSPNYLNFLDFSIRTEKINISEYLLKLQSQDKNYVFSVENGEEFLMAVGNGYENLVKLFIDRGVDINVTNKRNQNALSIALDKKNHQMAELLVSYKDSNGNLLIDINYDNGHLLRKVINENDVIGVMFLLDNGADVNAEKNGLSCFCYALQQKRHKIAALMLEKRPIGHQLACDVNNNNGFAIIDAVSRHNLEFLKLLIVNGGDIMVQNLVALERAVSKKQYDIVEYILSIIKQ